jgi:hypothetical protein
LEHSAHRLELNDLLEITGRLFLNPRLRNGKTLEMAGLAVLTGSEYGTATG